MESIFDLEAWRLLLVNSMTELGARITRFLPGLTGALLILLIGWLLARVVRAITTRALRRLGLDRAAERLELLGPLRRAGIARQPSAVVGGLIYWILMLTFLLSAVETLGLSAVTSTIDRLIAYLPHVVAATFILILGLLAGRLARNLVSSGAAAMKAAHPERLGAVIHGVVVAIVAVLALEQLGVETALLITIITVLLGVAGLSMGIAFALGARQLVAHILAGHYLRQSLPGGRNVEVLGRRGEVERVGPVDTLLRSGDESWSVPNATLIEQVIVH